MNSINGFELINKLINAILATALSMQSFVGSNTLHAKFIHYLELVQPFLSISLINLITLI